MCHMNDDVISFWALPAIGLLFSFLMHRAGCFFQCSVFSNLLLQYKPKLFIVFYPFFPFSLQIEIINSNQLIVKNCTFRLDFLLPHVFNALLDVFSSPHRCFKIKNTMKIYLNVCWQFKVTGNRWFYLDSQIIIQ